MGLHLIVGPLISLIIGAMMGIERDLHAKREGDIKIAGLPLFIAVSLLGYFFSYSSGYLAAIIFLMVLSLLAFLWSSYTREKGKLHGLTTGVLFLLCFSLGVMSGLGYYVEALLISMVVLTISALKERTHAFAGVLSASDIAGALHFLSVSMVLLPLAYTMGEVHPLIGPGKLMDPVKVILMVIFVSSISFTGYFLVKIFGPSKGSDLSSFLGGFVNSAATTASLSRRSRLERDVTPISLRGILLSNLAMVLKDVILITVLIGTVFIEQFMIPLIVLVLVSLIPLAFISTKSEPDMGRLDLGSPFAMIPAAKFAFLFLFISIATHFSLEILGDIGVYGSSLGGLVSTTSVSASLSALFGAGAIGMDAVLVTLMLAIAAGSISKVFIAYSYDRDISRKLLPPLSLTAVLSIAMALFYHLVA